VTPPLADVAPRGRATGPSRRVAPVGPSDLDTPSRPVDRIGRRSALVGLVALTAAACSSGSGTVTASDSGAGFPRELANCDAVLHLEAAPQRVVLLESAPVTTLDGIGVLDRVIARAGAFPPDYYSADLAGRIGAISALSEDIDASGHLLISSEVVISQAPDLVLGLPDGVTREAMRDAGAEVMVQDVYCADGSERASFDTLSATITTYGRVFDRPDQADELIGALTQRIAAVSDSAAALATTTAAVLYPSLGGGPLYTYGAGSMATAQLDALGIENVFAGTAERVFEISSEPLLAADPDVLIVLHQGEGDGSDAIGAMISQDQLSGLRAVEQQAVLPLLFNFAEPASPLVVDGLERILAWLLDLEG
jgi:iron complex transport system substrate-binding protein